MTMMRPQTAAYLLTRGNPPASSYWVGATRDELAAAIAARRPQMACGEPPGRKMLAWDNGIAAEASLRTRLALHRAQRRLSQGRG